MTTASKGYNRTMRDNQTYLRMDSMTLVLMAWLKNMGDRMAQDNNDPMQAFG